MERRSEREKKKGDEISLCLCQFPWRGLKTDFDKLSAMPSKHTFAQLQV
jgi:hypothetical protein